MDFAEHHKGQVAKGMDKALAKDNLFAIADILDGLGLRYFFFFGTLLGAIREKDFIAHDTDTDLGVFPEFAGRVDEVRAAAEAAGFSLLRGAPGERLFSFMRGNEYLDCYVAERGVSFPGRRTWDIDGTVIPARLLDNPASVSFLGRAFNVPADTERVLAILYGRRWRTPVLRFPGRPSFGNRVTRFLKQPDKLDALRRHFRIRREANKKKDRA